MIKNIKSVMSHGLYLPISPVTNCHTFSNPSLPLEHDILHGLYCIVFSFYWKKTLLTERNKWNKLV